MIFFFVWIAGLAPLKWRRVVGRSGDHMSIMWPLSGCDIPQRLPHAGDRPLHGCWVCIQLSRFVLMYTSIGIRCSKNGVFDNISLPMLRLLSPKAQEGKDFWKPSTPCHVGIHWIAFAEYSQVSTHVPEFQSFFRFFSLFCNGQI